MKPRPSELIFLLTFLSLFTTSVSGQDDPPSRVGRLSYVQGQVSFQPAGVEDWAPAGVNRPLSTGDRLWADRDGRAVIQLGSADIHLNSQTSFSFLNLNDRAAQIRLTEGDLNIRLRHLFKDEAFEIDTPNIAVSLLHNGEYRLQVRPDGITSVIVRSGEAELTGGGQSIAVHKHQLVQITGGDPPAINRGHAPEKDGFDLFCESRVHREERSLSARYVSRNMAGYEDLDDNGDWRDAPGYGHVWYPRAVAADWAPYHDGHWAWVDPWGWTWVDDAPWGFAPFHYGRWASIGGGWGWVPPIAAEPVYAPALVGFVGAGPDVGWFPLGPGDVYEPGYRASEGYWSQINRSNTVINRNVNITKIYNDTNNSINNSNNTNHSNNTDNSINHSQVGNQKYVNQKVPGAVTAVTRNAFASGQPVAQARVAVAPQQISAAQVLPLAAVVPSHQALAGSFSAAKVAQPTAASRAVISKQTPPPSPVPFAQQQKALAANPGRPLAPATLQNLRRNMAAEHQAPALSTVPAPAAYAPDRATQPAGTRQQPPSVAPRANNPDRPYQPLNAQPSVAPRPNNPDRPPGAQPSAAPRANNPERPNQPLNAQPNVVPRPNNADRPPSSQPSVAPRANSPDRHIQPANTQPNVAAFQNHGDRPPIAQPSAPRAKSPDQHNHPANTQPYAAAHQNHGDHPPSSQPSSAPRGNHAERQRPAQTVQPSVTTPVNNPPRPHQPSGGQPSNSVPHVNKPAPPPSGGQQPHTAPHANHPSPTAQAPSKPLPPRSEKKDDKTPR